MTTTICHTVAGNIKRIAKTRNLDNERLMGAMGIDAKALELTLMGVRAPRIDELASLAQALGITVVDLIAHRADD